MRMVPAPSPWSALRMDQNGVQYIWTQKDPILAVSLSVCDPNLFHTCTAWNPVSQNSSQPVHLWQFFTGKWLHSHLSGDSRNSLSTHWGLKISFRCDIDGIEKKEIKPKGLLLWGLTDWLDMETLGHCGTLRAQQGRKRGFRGKEPNWAFFE